VRATNEYKPHWRLLDIVKAECTRTAVAAALDVEEEAALPPDPEGVVAVAWTLAELSRALQVDAGFVGDIRVAEPLKSQALAALPLLDCCS
jgi:hypothetical protein